MLQLLLKRLSDKPLKTRQRCLLWRFTPFSIHLISNIVKKTLNLQHCNPLFSTLFTCRYRGGGFFCRKTRLLVNPGSFIFSSCRKTWGCRSLQQKIVQIVTLSITAGAAFENEAAAEKVQLYPPSFKPCKEHQENNIKLWKTKTFLFQLFRITGTTHCNNCLKT